MLCRSARLHIGQQARHDLLLKLHGMVHTPRKSRPLASADAMERIWLLWRISIHVLVALLCAVVFVRDGFSWPLAAFIVTYAAGRWVPVKQLWVLAVLVLWVVLLIDATSAGFLAFALYFLVINTLRPALAVPSVGLIAGIAVYGLGRHNGWSIGGVVGPIVGALVACVLGYGFLQLRRESYARVAASRQAGEAGERARLAGEIHDTIAQGLSSIQMLLHSAERRVTEHQIDDPDLLRELRLARNTAADNVLEARQIIAALQPQPLVGTQLPVALARVVANTPQGQAIAFATDGQPRQLPEDVEAALMRVTQSLVSNVVRHAHATRAQVTLTYQPDQVSVDVVDNGVGFDYDAQVQRAVTRKSGAEGILGVRTRVAKFGGDVHVETAPGHGCGVSVMIPTAQRQDTDRVAKHE